MDTASQGSRKGKRIQNIFVLQEYRAVSVEISTSRIINFVLKNFIRQMKPDMQYSEQE